MKIGRFSVVYLSHVCFILQSPGGIRILTDPFFASGFSWRGHWESCESPPSCRVSDLPACHAVFVSHIHGDHYDPGVVERLLRRGATEFWAPPEVTEHAKTFGSRPPGSTAAKAARLVPLSEGMTRRLGDVSATFYAGYDDSSDSGGRANKFSFAAESGGTRIFYSGDCHQPPPAAAGMRCDAVFAWPHPDDEKLRFFAASFDTDLGDIIRL